MKQTTPPDRMTAPLAAAHLQMQMEEPRCVTLDNGMKACFITAGQEQVSRIDLIYDAGSAFQDKRLVAAAVNRLLREGTQKHTALDIATLIDYHGAYLDTQTSKDVATVTLYSLDKHLPVLLPLMAEILTEPSFTNDELSTYIERQRQEFLTNNAKVKYRAGSLFNQLVYGKDTAYGQQLIQTDFDQVRREDIITFYDQHYRPGKAWLLVSGAAGEELLPLLNRTLGALPHQQAGTNGHHLWCTTPVAGDHREVREGVLQSALRVGRPVPGKDHADYHALRLLNTLMGGYFGSRLMSNLREDKGYTYGIGSYLTHYRHGAALSIATEVNATHTEAALAQICHELTRLRTEPVGDEELTLVKNYLYGTFLRSFDGPFALAERYMAVAEVGLTFEHYHHSLASMLQTTPQQLMEVANRYLDPDTMIRLVVGPQPKS